MLSIMLVQCEGCWESYQGVIYCLKVLFLMPLLLSKHIMNYLPYVCDLDSNTTEQEEGQQTSTSALLDVKTRILTLLHEINESVPMYDKWMVGNLSIQYVWSSILSIESMTSWKISLQNWLIGYTSKLWLQYIEMIDLLRQLIKAERMGDWTLHVKATRDEAILCCCTGNNLHAKPSADGTGWKASCGIFAFHSLMLVKELTFFKDLIVIEKTLMETTKTSADVTHGWGIDLYHHESYPAPMCLLDQESNPASTWGRCASWLGQEWYPAPKCGWSVSWIKNHI